MEEFRILSIPAGLHVPTILSKMLSGDVEPS